VVEYDGPSLSDTSSLVSLDEYRERNGSQQSISFTPHSVDWDDDSVTVSSRDNSVPSARSSHGLNQTTSSGSEHFTAFSPLTSVPRTEQALQTPVSSESVDANPFADDVEHRPSNGREEDPTAVFERLRIQDALSDRSFSVDYDTLARNDRGVAWLRDQNERAIRARLGPLPQPSVSDEVSSAVHSQDGLGGALELERDPRGRYYYAYISAGPPSQSQDSGYDDGLIGAVPPRPTSRQLHWLESHQIPLQDVHPAKSSHPNPSLQQDYHLPDTGSAMHQNPDQDVGLFFIPVPPQERLTNCSGCGSLLDGIRYVCSTCGEKSPIGVGDSMNGEGGTFLTHDNIHSLRLSPPSLSPASSQTYIGSYDSLGQQCGAISSDTVNAYLTSTAITHPAKGYELCSSCLQSAGVNHAIEAGIYVGSSLGMSSPGSPGNSQAASQWRRAAPKKGHLRHAYHEKVWGQMDWEDVGKRCSARSSSCILS